MSEVPSRPGDGAGRYEIRVKGHLAARWAAWFDGMTMTRHDDGTTVLHGTVADQSALHGLLRKLNDLGVPLLSVTRTRPNDAEAEQREVSAPAAVDVAEPWQPSRQRATPHAAAGVTARPRRPSFARATRGTVTCLNVAAENSVHPNPPERSPV